MMRSNLGVLLIGALVAGLSAPVYAGVVGTEEDAAVPPGAFVSTMTDPGPVAVKQAAASTEAVKVVRVARAAK